MKRNSVWIIVLAFASACRSGTGNKAGTSTNQSVQALCDAYLAAHRSSLLRGRPAVCDGTDLALFEHDAVAAPTTAPCLSCAMSLGIVDSIKSGTPEADCEDAKFEGSTTVAQCVAELQCGLGVAPTCSGSVCPTDANCKPGNSTIGGPLGGNAINNLYCGDLPTAACLRASPASSAHGSCAGPWLAGLPSGDAKGGGAVAIRDGSRANYASGFANRILTMLLDNCEKQCFK